MLSVLQLICLVFLSGGQAKTLGADVEGSSYAQVEEILLAAQVEQLRKQNLNLVENMRTLEIINKNLTQENVENMKKIGQLTKTIEDLHNATMQEIKSASLCQCVPEAPEASELELTSIQLQWSCPLDKVMIRNGSQIENTISLSCSTSNCSMEESSWPQCEDVLEKSWTPWVYVSCQMHPSDEPFIFCGSGHRSRSREIRSSSANPWRNETVTEQCQPCNVDFLRNYQGREITIIPLAQGNALGSSMDISIPHHTDVLKKSWTPWVYVNCQMLLPIDKPTFPVLCTDGSGGYRSMSREIRSSSADPWRNETFTEQCTYCTVDFVRNYQEREKSWTPWVYVSCQMYPSDDDSYEPIICGSGHRSRSREIKSLYTDPWRNETVTEQCEPCNVDFGRDYQGREITIIPLAQGNALKSSMDILIPIHTDVLEKSWTPWVYESCQMDPFGPGRTILCGLGSRSRSREVRGSLDHPWRSEVVTEQCIDCEEEFD